MEKSERLTVMAQAMIKATADSMVAFYTQFGSDEPWPTSAFKHRWAFIYCPFHPTHGGNCFWWTGQRTAVTL
jgi:hypothetical protein